MKKRLLVAGLLVFSAWPLVHRFLVARYDLDPWRFFGWAMYCVPKLDLQGNVTVVDKEGRQKPFEWTRLRNPVDYLETRDRFTSERQIWGDLVRPDEIAAVVFENLPWTDHIRIEVTRPVLDTSTSFVVGRTRVYEYERNGK